MESRITARAAPLVQVGTRPHLLGFSDRRDMKWLDATFFVLSGR